MRSKLSEDPFKATSKYYSQYRIGYPKEFINIFLKEANIESYEKLLDIGCGTGKLTFALSSKFKEVIALDISSEMLKEAGIQRKSLNLQNIQLINCPAENISPKIGKFNLITCGEAFHWMNREKVAKRSYKLLNKKGVFAILGSNTGSVWSLSEPWHKPVLDVIQFWLGDKRKNAYWMRKMHIKHEDILRKYRFKNIRRGIYQFNYTWTIESIIGNLYSTSFCNVELLGDNLKYFERDLVKVLKNFNIKGEYEELIQVYYIIANK
ncbi:class I SAM-dependent methyltransferase [Haloimpatiens lingqiaonensis]|uniref:class I SAM-dependent methyltransferase n=1 Tax=Haloimpatiens lingqiaonensis TaxID=1380675 RepID=UPI001485BF31|nr:class I SAM-dependent methyltransferase [Haloimpatiens lingqiaonensis]